MQADTIIIGAGLAGLAAAERLTRAGQHVLLLEARDRTGGRVLTQRIPGTDLPIELGAEWFDTHGELCKALEDDGYPLRTARGRFLLRSEDGWTPIDQEDDHDDPLDHLRRMEGPDRPLSEALRQARSAGLDPADERALLRYVQGFHAADPARLSSRWLLEVEKDQSAAASQVRSVQGVDRAVVHFQRRLGDRCMLRTGCVVQAIAWSPGEVRVQAKEAGSFTAYEAARAVITLPLPILQHPEAVDGVRFDPPLAGKREALGQLAMGHVVKPVFLFREAFWEAEPALRDALFMQDPRQPVPTWWTQRPEEAPLLCGWAGGPVADQLTGRTSEALFDAAIGSLAGLFGRSPAFIESQVVGWRVQDWAHDPFARGAYSYVLTGGIHAHASLAAPLERTLYFAGEATCGGGYNATMEGAVRSGRRAAQELLDELARHP